MTAFVIVGVMRSGTSLLSSILLKGGVFMGDRFQDPHPTFQPNGFFEDLDFLELNEKMLVKLGASVGAGMLYSSKPSLEKIKESAMPYLDSMSALIADRQKSHEDWGFKDPRLITTYPVWKSLLPADHKVIWAYRRPESVLRSMAKHSKITQRQANDVLTTIKYHCDKLSQTLVNSIMVDFDKLRTRNGYEVWRLAERLKISQDVILECIK